MRERRVEASYAAAIGGFGTHARFLAGEIET
jgi:hypothetical protein